jgi:hypothetical protein
MASEVVALRNRGSIRSRFTLHEHRPEHGRKPQAVQFRPYTVDIDRSPKKRERRGCHIHLAPRSESDHYRREPANNKGIRVGEEKGSGRSDRQEPDRHPRRREPVEQPARQESSGQARAASEVRSRRVANLYGTD